MALGERRFDAIQNSSAKGVRLVFSRPQVHMGRFWEDTLLGKPDLGQAL
jgi:hypothetical protein